MRSPAKKRPMTTPEIVLYDQTGPAAGTRAATRSSITALTRKKAAPSFQTQPMFLTVFDPHFGHLVSVFMGSTAPALCARSILPFLDIPGSRPVRSSDEPRGIVGFRWTAFGLLENLC